jgi:hypothetical protein
MKKKKSPVSILELSQKFDFQSSTTKWITEAIKLSKPNKFDLLMVSKMFFHFVKI